jgi:hypothetical protein
MGTAYITGGWLYFADAAIGDSPNSMSVLFQQLSYDYKRKPTFIHTPGGTNISYDIGPKYLIIDVKNVMFSSYSNYETFVKYMNSWQDSLGYIFTSVIYLAAGTKAELKGDGSATEYKMAMKTGLEKIEKISAGDNQVWAIGSLRLEEGG